MSTGHLTIDLDAVVANYRALDAKTTVETAAVVKADGYGLGARRVSQALKAAGVTRFFVAVAEEGAELRKALGDAVEINVFSGHMLGDTDRIAQWNLVPMLNSLEQMTRHFDTLPRHPFGVQLDTGMNRLGLEIEDWAAVAEVALGQNPTLLMSHLACADEPDHPMNAYQREQFEMMTEGMGVPRSLGATGGILLGPDYHYDLTRAGVGLYGGLPFTSAKPVVRMDLPVVQTRKVKAGETVGYGNAWMAQRASRIATVSTGYADGVHRAISGGATFFAGKTPLPLVGRVSMDLITVDVTDLPEPPEMLTLLGPSQTVDDLARDAGTIGYEVLTSFGRRFSRRYTGGR